MPRTQWNMGDVPTAESQEDWGQEIAQASASSPLLNESLVQVLSDSEGKTGDAPSRLNRTCCWWRGTCCKSTGKSFTWKRWHSAPDSALGESTGPKEVIT
jgi:hypothetical protein